MTTTSGTPNVTPIREMIGIRMMDATVCDTKVATVPAKKKMYVIASHGE